MGSGPGSQSAWWLQLWPSSLHGLCLKKTASHLSPALLTTPLAPGAAKTESMLTWSHLDFDGFCLAWAEEDSVSKTSACAFGPWLLELGHCCCFSPSTAKSWSRCKRESSPAWLRLVLQREQHSSLDKQKLLQNVHAICFWAVAEQQAKMLKVSCQYSGAESLLQPHIILLPPLRNCSLATNLALIISNAFFTGESRCLFGICKAYQDPRAEEVCKK